MNGIESLLEPEPAKESSVSNPEVYSETISILIPHEDDAATPEAATKTSELVSEDTQKPTFWQGLISMLATVLNASATAALQAIFFARLGTRIDRPLWRCTGPGDALKRFFMPWFILNLGMLALMQLTMRFNTSQAAMLFFMFFMVGFIVMVPLGTCIMYHGRLHWPEVPIALQPIAKQFSPSMAVMAISFLEFMLLLVFFEMVLKYEILQTSSTLSALVNAPFALIECFVVAAMFRVCMIHRDSLSDEDPYKDL